MFQVGECVVKAYTGICRIEAITNVDWDLRDKNKLFYMLVPMNDMKSKIYVPVEPEPANIRRLLSKEEAEELLCTIPRLDEITIVNEKQREHVYREIIKSNNPEKLARIIKTIYMKSVQRTTQGKKLPEMDKRYFDIAEGILYAELATVLGKEITDIPLLIAEIVKNGA